MGVHACLPKPRLHLSYTSPLRADASLPTLTSEALRHVAQADADAPTMADAAAQSMSAEELAAKRDADKKRKAAEKAEKEAKKEAARKEREAAQAAKAGKAAAAAEADGPALTVPKVTLRTYDAHDWGELFIQSDLQSASREWVQIGELTPAMAGKQVWLRARVQTSRKQGKMLAFLQLRQSMHTAQAVVYSKESDIVPFAAALPRESVVDILGELTVPEQPIASCTASGIELQVKKLFCVSRSAPELPLQLEDASRSDVDLAADPELPRVNQDVRLNNRVIDLRTAANQAIFRLQSGVCQLFRGFLRSQGFTEIHTPKLVGTASEGGADVFKVGACSLGNVHVSCARVRALGMCTGTCARASSATGRAHPHRARARAPARARRWTTLARTRTWRSRRSSTSRWR